MAMLLELNHVTRLYGVVMGVNDVNLALPPGAYGLLGPNGAGKSTLLNLITGQLSPNIGSLKVLGQSPRNCEQLMSRIGYLPGSEGMYADVSALEWVSYLNRLHGYDRREASRRAEWALAQVQLTEHQHRKIATFSRGMRQRTRIAQAIAHEPDFLILDEPFSGLDPIARHAISTLLRQWIDQGRSLLIASHVLYEIESLTRSFILLSGGRVLAHGAADDIQAWFTNAPAEVFIRTDRAGTLASELLARGVVHSAVLHSDSELSVTTNSIHKLSNAIQTLIFEMSASVFEIRSSDDSLQDVFHRLMKLQRGGR